MSQALIRQISQDDLLEAVVDQDGSIHLLPKMMVDRALVEKLVPCFT